MTALPMEWRVHRLEQILRPQSNKRLLQQGWSPQCEARPSTDTTVWGVLKTTAIQPGWFDETQNKELPATLAPRPAVEVQPGDMLMTCAGPRARCGVPTLVRRTRPRLMMSGKMYRFRPTDEVDPGFLELFLLSPDVQSRINEMKTGISDSGLNLTQDRFLQLPVVVPPLAEQLRIVDILEDHLSRLDGAEGFLTAARRRSQQLRSVALESLSPPGAAWRTLAQLCVDSGYGTSTKCVAGGLGAPVVRIPNLTDGRVDLTEEKRAVESDVDLSRLMLEAEDLLVVRTNGSRDLIGRAAVVQSGIVASFASYLIRFKIDPSQARPQWVRVMLGTPSARRVLESMAASSAGQYNLGLKKLNNVLIPCPPLEEQDRLIAKLDGNEWAHTSLTRSLDTAGKRAYALRRTLLAAAFSGRLTGRSSDMELVEEMAGV